MNSDNFDAMHAWFDLSDVQKLQRQKNVLFNLVLGSGIVTEGQGGQSSPLDTKKLAKNWEKEGENQEKVAKERKKLGNEEKSGRFFHSASPDR